MLGTNGAGKSTTFKALTNVVQPSSGEVLINNQDIGPNFDKLRKEIGYCPQEDALFPGLSVEEHLRPFNPDHFKTAAFGKMPRVSLESLQGLDTKNNLLP